MGKLLKRERDEGASLIEFGLIAPLLFLLLFGVVEVARVVHGYSTVWTAAREGARYATTVADSSGNDIPNYADCDAIVEAAQARVTAQALDAINVTYFDRSGVPVADCATSPPGPGDIDNGFTIEVEATASFNGVVPLLTSFFDGLDLTSQQTRSIFKGVVGGE